MLKQFVVLCLLASFISNVSAKENVNSASGQHRGNPTGNNMLAGCTPSTAITSLDINNVRTVILINGDMWWNAVTLVNVALYEIPKGSGKTSLFAGSIWIGGLDNASNLYTAAQTYRQTGVDFWPGPVDTTTTSITPGTCNKFDKHFKLTREEVESFTADYAVNGSSVTVPDAIKNWPGNGTGAQAHFLAPFYDNDGDGLYRPENGDFPKYYFEKLPQGPGGYPVFSNMEQCGKDILLGDQTLWWVFNDVGNIHTETSSANPIGLEIRAQAFAFTTNDDINNMTFYRYQIINRNTTVTLNNTYFGAWVDPDLGNANDDYVGCDVKRGLGIVYNSDNDDEGAQGYGANPPAAGLDFFEGPLADIGDNIDNDRDSCVDCTKFTASNGDIIRIHDDDTYYTVNSDTTHYPGPYVTGGDTISGREKIIMSKFVYYNNDFTVKGNPTSSHDYYNYLIGKWLDNAAITYGGDGKGTGPGATTIPANFMFPGTSDPNGWGTYPSPPQPAWSEETAADAPGDRRFLQTAGPFTLTPGAVNYITTGAVWARASAGGPSASVNLLKRADDYAQGLFDHCFKVTDGPDAPDVQIRELNRQFILTLTNDNPLRNNYKENYSEVDPNFVTPSFYYFEGYRIFQVKDVSVTSQELCNPDRAREVAQYDIKNGVGQIINYVVGKVPCSNVAPAGSNWNAYIGVDGADKGISHSLVITKDFFNGGPLINHKTYYYMAIAYAYNANEVPPIDPYTTPVGKNFPYLAGRNNIKIYAAIPHDISSEMGGTVAGSLVGDGPEITRIEGGGNGVHNPNALEFKSSDNINPDGVSELASAPYYIHYPTYTKHHGPVAIQVYDPYKVSGGDFELWATDTSSTGSWVLKNLNTGGTDSSQKTLASSYEQIFANYGFSVNMFQNLNGRGGLYQPGDSVTGGKITSGFVTSSMVNQGSNWLSGVSDVDDPDVTAGGGTLTAPDSYYDWIATGAFGTDYKYSWGSDTNSTSGTYQDGDQIWETILGGTWAPFRFTRLSNTASVQTSPGPWSGYTTFNPGLKLDVLEKFMPSVDIVFTSNKSLWTKCPVLEMQFTANNAVGNAPKNSIRRSPSLDKDFNVIPGDSGFSYFPGYAVSVETGERLNMAFGEDSYIRTAKGFPNDMGADMKWNPDANDTVTDPNSGTTYYSFGGKHVVFVFAHIDTTIIRQKTGTIWLNKDTVYMPAYDEGVTLAAELRRSGPTTNQWINKYLRQAWATCAWVGYTKLASGFTSVPLYNGGGNDVRIRIRVDKPYQYFNTGTPPSPFINNNGMPHYKFSMNDYTVTKNKTEIAKNALDSINVVPNPYYAYSDYDKKAFDSRIKIVNLPSNCKVTIYTTSGTLIRTLYRDVVKLSEGTSMGADISGGFLYDNIIEWDLRNEKGVPVASGIYLIHVEAPGLGERTMKWFGVMRPIDLDTF